MLPNQSQPATRNPPLERHPASPFIYTPMRGQHGYLAYWWNGREYQFSDQAFWDKADAARYGLLRSRPNTKALTAVPTAQVFGSQFRDGRWIEIDDEQERFISRSLVQDWRWWVDQTVPGWGYPGNAAPKTGLVYEPLSSFIGVPIHGEDSSDAWMKHIRKIEEAYLAGVPVADIAVAKEPITIERMDDGSLAFDAGRHRVAFARQVFRDQADSVMLPVRWVKRLSLDASDSDSLSAKAPANRHPSVVPEPTENPSGWVALREDPPPPMDGLTIHPAKLAIAAGGYNKIWKHARQYFTDGKLPANWEAISAWLRREYARFREAHFARAERRRAHQTDPLLHYGSPTERLKEERRHRADEAVRESKRQHYLAKVAKFAKAAPYLDKRYRTQLEDYATRSHPDDLTVDLAEEACIRGTLAALALELRRRGWEQYHASVRGGLRDSRYLKRTLPSGREQRVRISDHSVPATPEREFYGSNKGGADEEMIIDGHNCLTHPATLADQIESLFADDTDEPVENPPRPGVRREGILAKRKDLTPERLAEIAQGDPTGDVDKYLNWLLREVDAKRLRMPEDAEGVREALAFFQAHQARFPRRDINTYTVSQLYEAVDTLSGADLRSKREVAAHEKHEGAQEIFNDGKWRVLKMLTPEAAFHNSQGTKWCTGYKESGRERSAEYLKEGPLYLFLKAKPDGGWEKQYQMHAASEQFMDINNAAPASVPRDSSFLSAVEAATLNDGTAQAAVRYAREVVKGRVSPELEAVLARGAPGQVVEYASSAVKGRVSPELEAVIARGEPSQVVWYARYAVQGRVSPELEAVIARGSPGWVVLYAEDAVKGRVSPELEAVIARGSPGQVVWYARYAVQGRVSPELEAVIAKNPHDKARYQQFLASLPPENREPVENPPRPGVRREGILAKRKDLTPERLAEIAQGDPTGDVDKYLNWLLREVDAKRLRMPEDAATVKPVLELFDKAKTKFPRKDILTYTVSQLYAAEMALQGTSDVRSKRQIEREEKLAGGKEVYNDGVWRVLEITTPEAACIYAKGTKWCTSRAEIATAYLKDGPLFVFFKRVDDGWVKQYQAHFALDPQFMDETDYPVDYRHFSGGTRIPLERAIKSVVLYSKSPHGAWWAVENVMDFSKWPEAEHLLAQDPDTAFSYAVRVLKKRWGAAEKVILERGSPGLASQYAYSIIQGRWPEAEPLIAKQRPATLDYLRLLKENAVGAASLFSLPKNDTPEYRLWYIRASPAERSAAEAGYKGQYRALKVERAKQAWLVPAGKRVAWIDPAIFLEAVKKQTGEVFTEDSLHFKPATYESIHRQLRMDEPIIVKDIPFLQFNNDGKVINHEGRNRAYAAKNSSTFMPVQYFDTKWRLLEIPPIKPEYNVFPPMEPPATPTENPMWRGEWLPDLGSITSPVVALGVLKRVFKADTHELITSVVGINAHYLPRMNTALRAAKLAGQDVNEEWLGLNEERIEEVSGLFLDLLGGPSGISTTLALDDDDDELMIIADMDWLIKQFGPDLVELLQGERGDSQRKPSYDFKSRGYGHQNPRRGVLK